MCANLKLWASVAMEKETKNRKMSIFSNLKVIEERYKLMNLGLVWSFQSNAFFIIMHSYEIKSYQMNLKVPT